MIPEAEAIFPKEKASLFLKMQFEEDTILNSEIRSLVMSAPGILV
jgi:hypothetical protein